MSSIKTRLMIVAGLATCATASPMVGASGSPTSGGSSKPAAAVSVSLCDGETVMNIPGLKVGEVLPPLRAREVAGEMLQAWQHQPFIVGVDFDMVDGITAQAFHRLVCGRFVGIPSCHAAATKKQPEHRTVHQHDTQVGFLATATAQTHKQTIKGSITRVIAYYQPALLTLCSGVGTWQAPAQLRLVLTVAFL